MEQSSPSAVQGHDLPDELLGMIFSKVTSLRGRVRFAAICKSWRVAASLLPAPPALPLLILPQLDNTTKERSMRLYLPEDDSVLRVPLPHMFNSLWINGSYDGGWIASSPSPHAVGVRQRPIIIMNLFSGADVTLSDKQRMISFSYPGCSYSAWKIIFSEAPTSRSCILAAITNCCSIALCRIGCPDAGWRVEEFNTEMFEDIMFFRGNLYGLERYTESLFKFDIGVTDRGVPVLTTTHQLDVQRHDSPVNESKIFNNYSAYIFELRGKLAMAVNTIWIQDDKRFCRVYELVDGGRDDDTHMYKWSEVHNLGDYALFLGQRCPSKAVPMPTGVRGGVEKNRIYYSNRLGVPPKQDDKLDGRMLDDDMKCFRKYQSVGDDGGSDMVRIPTVGYYDLGCSYTPVWCFPPEL
jgi:hypothetical protein